MPRKRKVGSSNNRTDLTVPKVPTGLPYGEAQQLAQAQSAVPVPTSGPQQPMDWQRIGNLAASHPTGQVVGLDQPTQRPDEPITAGMSMGAGPGADFSIARNDPTADILTRLEAFYMRWPTPEMSRLLQEARRG